jgi:hypothetical protein
MPFNLKLKKGSKDPKVPFLKACLNGLLNPDPGLDTGDEFDQKTQAAVIKFQTLHQLQPDGVVDASTWKVIGEEMGPLVHKFNIYEMLNDFPDWLSNFFDPRPVSAWSFRRDVFFGLYYEEYGPPPNRGHANLERLLSFIEADPDILDVRWAAYMLATVKTECGPDYQSRKEVGCVEGNQVVCPPFKDPDTGVMRDRLYGQPLACPNALLNPPQPCPAGKSEHHYYGRGYVQITTRPNYEKFSNALYGDDRLIHFPEKVLEPETAYAIMSLGMREGMFRGNQHTPFSLELFIHDDACDYFKARDIVNAIVSKVASQIEKDAHKIEAMLLASFRA